ncbi:sulfatase [Planctomycetales bacterium]|nr:sulfatase [Planctomycetales bacterium]
MNSIVISIDGLHSGFFGCFGNTWVQTPAVDSLAAQSVLFGRYYTDTLKLSAALSSLWNYRKSSVLHTLAGQGIETIWMTDNEALFLNEHTDGFSKRFFIDRFDTDVPADTFEQTGFYRSMFQLIETARRQAKHWKINRQKQFFLWMHLSGFRGLWDFPSSYRNKHRDIKEDPPPYMEVHPPKFLTGNSDSENSGIYLPDRIQSVTEAYSGGIANLDDALAMLLDAAENGDFGKDTALILFSVRGFSLAEHGKIGITDDYYNENIHLPLLICFPQNSCAGIRSSSLLNQTDLAEFFCGNRTVLEKNPSAIASLALDNPITGESPVRKYIRFQATANQKAVITPDWFLRQTTAQKQAIPEFAASVPEIPELYVKPDDYWEVNNVADRCPETVESLTAEFF